MAYGDGPFGNYSFYDLTDKTGIDGTDDDNENGFDPVEADARAKAASIEKNQNQGGVDVSGQGITNTATFPGDYQTGQTFGNPNPLSTTGDEPPPMPGMPGQKPNTAGYNQPLLGGTPVGSDQSSINPGPGGTLSDKDRVIYGPDGKIQGVRDASGYYSGNDWAGYDNIINNAQRGDPFAIDKVAALARLGDARAQTVLGSTPGIGPNYKLGADTGTNSIFSSATFEDWRRAHNAEVGKNFGNQYANQPTGAYAGQRQWAPTEGGNQPNEKIYDNWAGVSLRDITKMMDATGRAYKGIDDYGNVHFQGNDGSQKVMPWWDAKNQVQKLYDDYVAAHPSAPPGGGGGRGPSTGRDGGYPPPGGQVPSATSTDQLVNGFGSGIQGGILGVQSGIVDKNAAMPYSPFQYYSPSDMQPYPNGIPQPTYSPNGGFDYTQGPRPAINPMTGTMEPSAPPSMQGVYAPSAPNKSGNGFLPPEDSPAYSLWNKARNAIGGTGPGGWGGMGPGWWDESGQFHPG